MIGTFLFIAHRETSIKLESEVEWYEKQSKGKTKKKPPRADDQHSTREMNILVRFMTQCLLLCL